MYTGISPVIEVMWTLVIILSLYYYRTTECTLNHLQMKAKGFPVVTIPLLLYTDDTSGNRSKKWNKFDAWCLLLAGLPRHHNSQLHNIHFLSCSNCMEMTMPIAQDLRRLEEGVVMYDSFERRDVLVIAPVIAVLADNPRHSEVLNHMGSSGNCYCRICMAQISTLNAQLL